MSACGCVRSSLTATASSATGLKYRLMPVVAPSCSPSSALLKKQPGGPWLTWQRHGASVVHSLSRVFGTMVSPTRLNELKKRPAGEVLEKQPGTYSSGEPPPVLSAVIRAAVVYVSPRASAASSHSSRVKIGRSQKPLVTYSKLRLHMMQWRHGVVAGLRGKRHRTHTGTRQTKDEST